jgi:hypothetical protein
MLENSKQLKKRGRGTTINEDSEELESIAQCLKCGGAWCKLIQ